MNPRRFTIRRASFGAALAAIILALATPAPAAAQKTESENLEAYLVQHGLDHLVVSLVERDLRRALGEDRVPIAERLAMLYGEMIDQAADDDERAMWERKSRELLDRVPQADSNTLRMNIWKASYLRAERLAELWRLRATDRESMLEARRIMSDLSPVLTKAYHEFDARVERLADLEVGGDPLRADRVDRELLELEALASQAAYYGAWASYYEAWLSDSARPIDQALEMFGHILQSDRTEPSLQELPDSLLGFEHVARAALGVAMSYGMTGRPNIGLDWIAAIDFEETNPNVREVLPLYRMVLLFDAENYRQIESDISLYAETDTLSPTMARLIATEALETLTRTTRSEPRKLAALAIAALSNAGELGQVLEIAEAFDLTRLGANDFVVAYVLALKAHERARQAHGSDEPTTDPELIDLYLAAAERLREAVARGDAADYPDAARHARQLLAWSYYYRSRFLEAAEAFRQFALEAPFEQAETAEWMQIVSLDQAWRQTRDPEIKQILKQAMDDFVHHRPSSQRSYRIQLRQVSTDDDASRQAVDMLRDIPQSSDVYREAQVEAERQLFKLFHDASGLDKIDLGREYLEVAEPLYRDDERLAFSTEGTTESRERYVTRARRLLDVQLTRGIARLREARQVLDRLSAAGSSGLVNIEPLRDEIDYRRFQIQVLGGEFEAAAQWVEELWAANPSSPFARAAAQDLFVYAVQDWRAFPLAEDLDQTLERVIRFGQRLVAPDGPLDSVEGDLAISQAATVAEAARLLGKRTSRTGPATLALDWYGKLLEAAPNYYPVVKANAEIAEEQGRREDALDLWRTAAAGLDSNDTEWFEAKYHQMRLLAEVDLERARLVMRQFELLHPNYGPYPWHDPLVELAERLNAARPTDSSGGGGGRG